MISFWGTYHIAAYAQSVGINASGATPHASAMLDVDVSALGANDKKGMLIPRVSLNNVTHNTTIPSPADSLIVYNTNTNMTGGNGQAIITGMETSGFTCQPPAMDPVTPVGCLKVWALTKPRSGGRYRVVMAAAPMGVVTV